MSLYGYSLLPIQQTSGSSSLGKAKVSINDTTEDYLLAKILGTTNQVVATETGDGGNETLVLSLPQDIHTGATPTFDDLTLSNPSAIYALSHDSWDGFVANEHVNHTAVTMTAGVGLSGGGDISTTRTLTLDLSELAIATVAAGDYVSIEDVTDNSTKKVTAQSIADLAAATPGGADTQVQYNNSGAFAGDAGFTYAGSGNASLTGQLTVDSILYGGAGSFILDTNDLTFQLRSGGNTRGAQAVDLQVNPNSSGSDVASAYGSSIGGGLNNRIDSSCWFGTVGGGEDNAIVTTGSGSTIGGGIDNDVIGAAYATVPGGRGCQVTGADYAFVTGGGGKVIGDFDVGFGNKATATPSTDNVHYLLRSTSVLSLGRHTNQSAVAGAANELRLHTILASNQSRYIGHKAGDALGSSTTYTWPVAGATGTVLYDTDGAGTLGWDSPANLIGSGFTAGSIPFSNGSTLTEDNANFFWDDTSDCLGIGTNSPGNLLTVNDGDIELLEPASDAAQSFIVRRVPEGATTVGFMRFMTGAAGSAIASTNLVADISGVITQGDPSALKGDLVFRTNAGDSIAEAMRITSAGNVGIGVTSSAQILTLKKTSGNNLIDFHTNTTTSSFIGVSNVGNNPNVGMAVGDLGFRTASKGMSFSNNGGSSSEVYFDSSAVTIKTDLIVDTDTLFVDSVTSMVGIGTSTPNAILDISAATIVSPHIRMSNIGGSGSGIFAYSSSPSHIYSLTRQDGPGSGSLNISAFGGIGLAAGATSGVSSTYSLFVSSTGNVGIGTTTPDTDLDVAGDMRFTSAGSGMVYAGLNVQDNATVTTISVSGTKVQFTNFDTNSSNNQMTPDHTNDHVTVDVAGDYIVTCSITADSAVGSAATFDFQLYKNNGVTILPNLHSHRDFAGGGGDAGSVSISGLVTLSATDTVELWVTNDTNTTNITLTDVDLTLVQVGGD